MLRSSEPTGKSNSNDSLTASGIDRLQSKSDRVALVLSLLMHSCLVGVVGWALMSATPNGSGEADLRSGGIVLVDARTEVTEYLSEGDVQPTADAAQQSAAAAAPAIESAPPDLPGPQAKDGRDGLADSVAESLDGINDLDLIVNDGGQFGGQVTTQIFGVSGTGSKFVYVFDRSDSMSQPQGKPIEAAKQELLKSLDSLQKSNQFQIIFYNKSVSAFDADGLPRLYYANKDNLKQAERFVKSVRPKGGTDHAMALRAAFSFKPDVIFLLTDADGFRGNLAMLKGLNRSNAVIYTVEFGSYRTADQSLKKLSEDSGGQYVFRNVNSLEVEK